MLFIKSLIKYLMEGLAVAVAVYLIPTKKITYQEIVLIALTAGAIFALLDVFSPSIGTGVRQGSGLAIGIQQVSLGTYGVEGFDPTIEADVCTNMSGSCTYSSVATEDQKEKYLCMNENNVCKPVIACNLNKENLCEVGANYKLLPDVGERKCTKKKVGNSEQCRLVKENVAVNNPTTSLSTSSPVSTGSVLPSTSPSPSSTSSEHFSDYIV